MDGHVHACHLGDGDNSLEEVSEIGAQAVGVDALVGVECFLEGFERVSVCHLAWKPRDHRPLKSLSRRRAHLLIARGCPSLCIVVVLGACTGSLKDVELECCKVVSIESKRPRTVLPFVLEVGARPIDNRHEVVAEDVEAASAEIAHRLLVSLDVLVAVASTLFDSFMHGHALDDAPAQALRFDLGNSCLDLAHRPDLTDWDVVQRRDDAGCTSLLDVLQSHWIVWSVPAPGLLHWHGCRGSHCAVPCRP
mmetsp:Transcript_24131/g.61694  ORF Transcript_24131/g.61694 Transcript_24131/m.61694 type:complete len:250 (+) Transcript_24131:811-1560(+)